MSQGLFGHLVSFLLTPQFWGTLIALLIGFGLYRCDRRRQIRNCKAALKNEIQICGRLAYQYTQGRAAPFYRLPVMAWTSAYPTLLGLGALGEEQTRTLSQYYQNVDTFNRGLEQAQTARNDNNGNGGFGNGSSLLNDDFMRGALQAENITNESESYLDSLRALV